jgi:hypothetical protein
MRIRLTFASEDELMRRCHLAIRLGVLFFPSSRIPESGTACTVEWHIQGEGLVLQARGLIAGPSVIEEEGKIRRGIWVRIAELPFAKAGLTSWLESIGVASSNAALEVPLAPPPNRPADGRVVRPPSPPAAPAPVHAPLLPDPSQDDDGLGWLSGSLRRSEP